MNQQPQTVYQPHTVAEAAKYFGRSRDTIYNWCIDGTLLAANCRVIREKPGNWTILIPKT